MSSQDSLVRSVFLSIVVVTLGCTGRPSSLNPENTVPSVSDEPSAPPGIPMPGEAQPGLPASDCRPPLRRWWGLTPVQVSNVIGRTLDQLKRDAIEDNVSLVTSVSSPYTSVASSEQANESWSKEMLSASAEVASSLKASNSVVSECLVKQDGCVETAFRPFVEKTWRRQTTAEELAALLQFQRQYAALSSPEQAAELTIRRILLGPDIVFRSERGVGIASPGMPLALSPFELADFVAMSLLDGPPDDELWKAAADGTLRQKNVLESQVRRLLGQKVAYDSVLDVGGKVQEGKARRRLRGVLRFFNEWLGAEDVFQRPLAFGKDNERFGRWLSNEPILLAMSVLESQQPTLNALLTSETTFQSGSLAAYYGLPEPSADVPSNTPSPAAAGRMGILTQGGFLIGHPTTSGRGKWIRSRLLCEDVPLPLEDVDMDLDGQEQTAEKEEKRPFSPREVRERHLKDPACRGCHLAIDPLGYPLDSFDAKGKVRSEWGGFPIDTKGVVSGAGDQDGPVKDSKELIARLSQSQSVRACFVRQFYTFLHGRSIQPEDGCYLQRLTANFERTQGNIRELVVDALTGEEVLFRTVGGQ
jgi:hypothetical protein